jgi:hypothetical protein
MLLKRQMEITILLDRDLEGIEVFLAAGLQETGWDQLVHFTSHGCVITACPITFPIRKSGGLRKSTSSCSSALFSRRMVACREVSFSSLRLLVQSALDPEALRQAATRVTGLEVQEMCSAKKTGAFVPAKRSVGNSGARVWGKQRGFS